MVLTLTSTSAIIRTKQEQNRIYPMFLTFYKEAVECGFPSPARDFTEGTIDLNEELIPHPNATFIVRTMKVAFGCGISSSFRSIVPSVKSLAGEGKPHSTASL